MPNTSADLINKLSKRREERSITKRKLADDIDVDEATIRRIENGDQLPGLNLFIKIANTLGYDVVLVKNSFVNSFVSAQNNHRERLKTSNNDVNGNNALVKKIGTR